MFGINFASASHQLDQAMQILGVSTWLYNFVLGGLTGSIVSIYLLIYTQYRWIIALYLIWIWVIDRDTPEKGGRPCQWVKDWRCWKYNRDYYPLRCEKVPGVELDPKRNYLLCCFPHGLLCSGVGNAFGVEDQKYFPQHSVRVATLAIQYKMPYVREMFLSMGGIPSSAKSIEYVLSKPGGGNMCALVVGGAKEAYYCKPGSYRLHLKERKGFVKLALRNGAPLVPVLSFGETDLHDQLEGPRIRKFQEFIRKWTGVAPVVPLGRFLLFPHKRMVTTVVGKPLDVPKITNPTEEDIDAYHAKFVEELTRMFEEQKYKYLEEPEEKKLIIE